MKKRVKKKIVLLFICVIFFLFFGIFIMVLIDNRYLDNIIKDLRKNTDISDIEYVNVYDNNYIVVNNEYLYLLDDSYKEITRIDKELMYINKNNYDIVYRDNELMYMNSYEGKDGVIFEYYDIYDYKFIEKIIVGGN